MRHEFCNNLAALLFLWTQDATALFAFPQPEADGAGSEINLFHSAKVHRRPLTRDAGWVNDCVKMFLSCGGMLLNM
jgi:hypothetical protein